MADDEPKSRTSRAIRAAGHRASGGHSLLIPRPAGHRLHREPNNLDHHHQGHRMTAFAEYPKWLHFEGEPSVLVRDADDETEALAAREPAAEKRSPGRPKKAQAEPAEKTFELAPGDDPDSPAESASEAAEEPAPEPPEAA